MIPGAGAPIINAAKKMWIGQQATIATLVDVKGELRFGTRAIFDGTACADQLLGFRESQVKYTPRAAPPTSRGSA